MKTTFALGMAAAVMLSMGAGIQLTACSSSSSSSSSDDGGTTGTDGSTVVKHDSGTTGGNDSGTGGQDSGGGTGPCATQCAQSLCAPTPVDSQPGDPCDTCVNNSLGQGQACNAPVVNACKADTDCVALLTCVNGAQSGNPPGCPADGGTPGPVPDGGAATDTACDQYQESPCIDCCSMRHQQGVNTFNTALINCVCGK